MPDRITIFRGPICRLARTEAELVQLVRHTVVHEVAHHFGISDQRLEELGFEPPHVGARSAPLERPAGSCQSTEFDPVVTGRQGHGNPRFKTVP